jgi:phosphopantetheinyl transferase (holo-ACP synthase)
MIAIAWAFVSGKLTAALGWITANATRMLAILLAVAVLWGWIERNSRIKAERVLASTEQAYRNAQKDAKLAQEALNARHVATNEAVNKGSTDDHAKGLSAARIAVADYARLHPVAKCAASGASAAAVHPDPGVDAGAGETAGMVSLTIADLDTLAAGTVRAESCRAWGQSMISAGLAEGD